MKQINYRCRRNKVNTSVCRLNSSGTATKFFQLSLQPLSSSLFSTRKLAGKSLFVISDFSTFLKNPLARNPGVSSLFVSEELKAVKCVSGRESDNAVLTEIFDGEAPNAGKALNAGEGSLRTRPI